MTRGAAARAAIASMIVAACAPRSSAAETPDDDAATAGAQDETAVDGGLDASEGAAPLPTRTVFVEHFDGVHVLPGGKLVAADWTDLTDGALLPPIDETENGPTSSDDEVWTDAAASGLDNGTGDCNAWTLASGSGNTGNLDSTSYGWTGSGSEPCNDTLPIYSFESRPQ